MAIPPPPYSNISGITRTIMKDNQTETIANYDGNARPGELVVNLNNNDVYIGDVNGNLLLINTGGGGTHADPAGPVGAIQFNAGGNLFGGTANVAVSGTGLNVTGNIIAGNITVATIASPGTGNVYVTGNLLPTSPDYNLGLPSLPWLSSYFGPHSVNILAESGNPAESITISNDLGNTIISAGGFVILGNNIPVFEVRALTGQLYSNAQTIIVNTTQSANTTSGSLQTAGGAGIAKNLYVGGNIIANSSLILSTLYQDGNIVQANATPLDLNKQVHKLADSWFSLADGVEGQICYFAMNDSSASAEDILIVVNHLRISQSGAANVRVNAIWRPFPYGPGNFVSTLASAIFTDDGWSVSQGTIV